MPYCNACGKYIREGLLCPYCTRVSPDDEYDPVPDEEERDAASFPEEPTDTSPNGEEPRESEESAVLTDEFQMSSDEEAAVPPDPEADASEGAEVGISHGGDAPSEGNAPSGDRRSAGATAGDPVPELNATFRRAYARILDTEDTTDRFSPRDVRAHRTMAALSYLGILWAIPFFFARTSRFVRFHLGQGLLLLLADGITATLLGLTLLLDGLAPAVSPALAAVVEVIAILSLVLKICGVTFALRGRARELPLIGSCADAA